MAWRGDAFDVDGLAGGVSAGADGTKAGEGIDIGGDEGNVAGCAAGFVEMTQTDDPEGRVHVITNWPALLERKQ